MKVQWNRTKHMNNISRANYAWGMLSNWTFQLPFNQVKLILRAKFPFIFASFYEKGRKKIINEQFICGWQFQILSSSFIRRCELDCGVEVLRFYKVRQRHSLSPSVCVCVCSGLQAGKTAKGKWLRFSLNSDLDVEIDFYHPHKENQCAQSAISQQSLKCDSVHEIFTHVTRRLINDNMASVNVYLRFKCL